MPHARFIEPLCYEAELVGMRVQMTEEGYTGQASFLDGDPLPVYNPAHPTPVFNGLRVKRGLYLVADSRRINADVNDAYNILRILRKVIPHGLGAGTRVLQFILPGSPWRMGHMAALSMWSRTIL